MQNLKELAEKCGVSIATVSNILNDKSNVSESTKTRVLKMVEELGYKPNYLARNLRIQKTNTIGLIIEDITAFSTSHIVEGIMGYLERHGYKVIFENLRMYSKYKDFEKEKAKFIKGVNAAYSQLMAFRVDGIIYIAAHSRHIDFLSDFNEVPLVLCYSECDTPDICEVVIDDKKAAVEMIDFFVEKGFSNIGIIKASEENVHAKKRLEGCLESIKTHKLKVNPDFIVQGDWTRESGYEACKKLFSNGFGKTEGKKTIFCFNDLMAAGVYDYLLEEKMEVGSDVCVAGFDNREISQFLRPNLTTLEIPLMDIGKKSAELLYNKISGIEQSSKKVDIPCRLIKRKSVR